MSALATKDLLRKILPARLYFLEAKCAHGDDISGQRACGFWFIEEWCVSWWHGSGFIHDQCDISRSTDMLYRYKSDSY